MLLISFDVSSHIYSFFLYCFISIVTIITMCCPCGEIKIYKYDLVSNISFIYHMHTAECTEFAPPMEQTDISPSNPGHLHLPSRTLANPKF